MSLPPIISFSKTKSVPVSVELQRQCQLRIEECVRIYHALGINMPMPTLSFDLRGRTAGEAYLERHHIRLNAVLLNENKDAFIDRTVGHEVAHLAARTAHGRDISAHGVEWQKMMRLIKQEPSRCHSFDTTNSAVRSASSASFTWYCACESPYLLNKKRHAYAKRGLLCCKRCKKILKEQRELQGSPYKPSLNGRAPTPAMVSYAKVLEGRTGTLLTTGILASYDETSAYITSTKLLPAKGLPLPIKATPLQTPTGGIADPSPTEKQLQYAEVLCKKFNVTVDPEIRASRKRLSDWISLQIKNAAHNPR